MANFVAAGQRIDVSHQLIRLAHIAADDPHQGLIHHAAIGQFHNGYVETFLIDTIGIRSKPSAPDINDMRGAGKEAHKGFVVVTGGYNGNVM